MTQQVVLPYLRIHAFHLQLNWALNWVQSPSARSLMARWLDVRSSSFLGIHCGSRVRDIALSASGLFLAAETVTTAQLSGRIVPQSGNNLQTIGKLFSGFLAGENQTLSVVGQSVDPCGCGEVVTWLSTAFKSLTLNVILPGQKFMVSDLGHDEHQVVLLELTLSQIIDSISISDLQIVMTEPAQAFAPYASSQRTLAEYRNPFGFELQVIQSAEQIIIGSGSADAAQVRYICVACELLTDEISSLFRMRRWMLAYQPAT